MNDGSCCALCVTPGKQDQSATAGTAGSQSEDPLFHCSTKLGTNQRTNPRSERKRPGRGRVPHCPRRAESPRRGRVRHQSEERSWSLQRLCGWVRSSRCSHRPGGEVQRKRKGEGAGAGGVGFPFSLQPADHRFRLGEI